MRVTRFGLLSAALVCTCLASASSPDFQVANNTALDAVCRVVINNVGQGTGTVYEKHVAERDANGNVSKWYLCILTAGHVTDGVGAAGVKAGFGNQDMVGPGPNLTDPAVFKQDDPFIGVWHRDLSVFVVKVNATAFFNNLKPLTVPDPALGDLSIDAKTPFSSVGYGLTGTFFNNGPAANPLGYKRNEDTYGVKRFFNQTVKAAAVINMGDWNIEEDGEGYPGGYCGPAIEWQLKGPKNANRVDGEGVAWGGDSGAPYLFRDKVVPYSLVDLKDWVTGNKLMTYSDWILGVHSGYTSGYPDAKHFRYMDDANGMGYGASLQEMAVRDWIFKTCDQGTPEPSGMAAAAMGIIGLLGARRFRKR